MKKTIFTGLFFALAVFLSAAGFTVSKIAVHRELDVERSHSFDVIRTLDSVVTGILDAENAWHNFIRNPDDPRNREAYTSAINRTFRHRDELKKIYSEKHADERFADLFLLINSRIEVLTELMRSDTERPGAETEAQILRREELINNALFQAIQTLEKFETEAILAFDAQMDTLSSQSLFALLVGIILCVMIFSILLYALHHELQVRGRLEREIKRQAHSDQLTGLPNRLSFLERLGYELTQASRSRQQLALLFLDIDHFKEINDSLGHEAGDILLREAAARMRATVRESDTVARIGGDEFNILLTNIAQTDSISLIAEKMIESFNRPFTISGQEIQSSCSIGISVYPEDGQDASELLRSADVALYHAKEQGRNNFKFYNRALNTRTQEKLLIEGSLKQTIEKNEMVLYYQPLLQLKERKIVCAEALVRWKHPQKGLLTPRAFIAVAEGIGFISALDEWVIRTACKQALSWGKVGSDPICLTVNISSRCFKKPGFVRTVRGILEETGHDPGLLTLEIAEQTAMENSANTTAKAGELRQLGIRLSIDHFGAGYFSFNELKTLSVDRIKIDRSLIREVDSDSGDTGRAIIKAMIVMAHTMGIAVVAEGVESQEQLRFLEANECDEVQGYLIGGPFPAVEFAKLTDSYAA